LPLPYFEQRTTGALVARLHGMETIREFVSGAAVTLLRDLPFPLIFLAVMFAYSWLVGLWQEFQQAEVAIKRLGDILDMPGRGRGHPLAACRINASWLALLLLPLIAPCSSGPLVKAAQDDEVRRLCAIDGWIKVYETVKLPADKFNEYGQINFYRATQGENALGPEYRFVEEITYY
jgi:hypothetical protein